MRTTLLFGALFSWIAACLYAYIGWRLGRRPIAAEGSLLAWRLFTLWWNCLAGTTFIGGLLSFFGAFGFANLALFVTATYLNILLVCVALWALLYYLIYLFTGKRKSLLPLSIFYVAYYVLLLYYIAASVPAGVRIDRWNATLTYQEPLTGPLFLLVLALLVFPQISAGLAYFTIFFRVKEATPRYRILLVSWSIIIWFGSAIVGAASGLSQNEEWQLASRFIGLLAPLLILIAYLPPRWLKKRYGILSLADEKSS